MRRIMLALCLLLGGAIAVGLVSAQFTEYRLVANSIGSGAGTMQSEDFVVDAVVGHGPAAGLAQSEDFAVGGSIWGGGPIAPVTWSRVYLPAVLKDGGTASP